MAETKAAVMRLKIVGLVRRRGVFEWTDSARPRTGTGYALQKICMNGSTGIPTDFEPPSPAAAPLPPGTA